MALLGVVKGSRIGNSFRSTKQVVILSVVIDDPKDVQSVEFLGVNGDFSIPVTGSTVLIHTVIDEYKVATAVNTGVVIIGLGEGERSVFAVNGEAYGGIIDYLKNGEVVINNGVGFAVEFNKLKVGFDQFKVDHNTHVHVETGASTNVPTVLSVATIDDSKVEKVRI